MFPVNISYSFLSPDKKYILFAITTEFHFPKQIVAVKLCLQMFLLTRGIATRAIATRAIGSSNNLHNRQYKKVF